MEHKSEENDKVFKSAGIVPMTASKLYVTPSSLDRPEWILGSLKGDGVKRPSGNPSMAR